MKRAVSDARLVLVAAIGSALYLMGVHLGSDERTEVRTMLVQPRVSELQAGLLLVDSLEPIQLTIEGPSRTLERIAEESSNLITVGPVNADTTTWTITREDVQLPDGVIYHNVRPSQISIPVQSIIEVLVDVEPHLRGRPADGFVVGEVTVSPDQVRLRGPASFLADVNRVDTAALNLDGATEDLTVQLPLGNLRAFVETAADTKILVSVAIEQDTGVAEFEAPLVFTSEGGSECRSGTELLEVRLEGPGASLARVNPDLILATVDCDALAAIGEGAQRAVPVIVGYPTDLAVVWQSSESVVVGVTARAPEPPDDGSRSGSESDAIPDEDPGQTPPL
jgi:YbbR domain-containing protein